MIITLPKNQRETKRVVGLLDELWNKAMSIEDKRTRCKALFKVTNIAMTIQTEAINKAKEVEPKTLIPINWKMRRVANIISVWLKKHGINSTNISDITYDAKEIRTLGPRII